MKTNKSTLLDISMLLLALIGLVLAFSLLLTSCSKKGSPTELASGRRNVIYSYKLDDVMYPEQYTHIVISFLKTDKEGNIFASSFPHKATKIKTFREKHPEVKILCSLGGGSNSDMLAPCIINAEARKKLAEQTAALIKDRELDGVDLDWEYYDDYKASNAAYLDLARQLRALLGKDYLITMAGQKAKEFYAEESIVTMMNEVLDFTSVMTYDFDYEYRSNGKIGFNGNFTETRALMEDYARYVSKAKLNTGIPYYGGKYQVKEDRVYARDEKAVSYLGSVNYPNVVKVIGDKAATPDGYADDNGVALAVDNKTLYIFDNETTVRTKAAWSCDQGFGGVMAWVASDDDGLATLQKAVTDTLNNYRK